MAANVDCPVVLLPAPSPQPHPYAHFRLTAAIQTDMKHTTQQEKAFLCNAGESFLKELAMMYSVASFKHKWHDVVWLLPRYCQQ